MVPQKYECHEPKHPYVILLEPLQPDGIGEAVLAGLAITQVDVIREIDPFAEVVEGNTTSLRSISGEPCRESASVDRAWSEQ